MREFKSFAALAICSAALVLASCGTTGSTRHVTAETAVVPSTVVVPSNVVAENIVPATTDPTQVTVGNLTDPCTLGMDDPWWIDHGGRVEFHRRCG